MVSYGSLTCQNGAKVSHNFSVGVQRKDLATYMNPWKIEIKIDKVPSTKLVHMPEKPELHWVQSWFIDIWTFADGMFIAVFKMPSFLGSILVVSDAIPVFSPLILRGLPTKDSSSCTPCGWAPRDPRMPPLPHDSATCGSLPN